MARTRQQQQLQAVNVGEGYVFTPVHGTSNQQQTQQAPSSSRGGRLSTSSSLALDNINGFNGLNQHDANFVSVADSTPLRQEKAAVNGAQLKKPWRKKKINNH